MRLEGVKMSNVFVINDTMEFGLYGPGHGANFHISASRWSRFIINPCYRWNKVICVCSQSNLDLEFLRAVLSIFCYPSCLRPLSWIVVMVPTWVWPPEFTWGCGVSVWSSLLHCGNAVAAPRGRSCRSGRVLDVERESDGAQAVRANHDSAKSFLFRPQSGNSRVFAAWKKRQLLPK